MSNEQEQLEAILEGAILAVGEPLTLDRMLTLFDSDDPPEKEALLEALAGIKAKCEGRGFTLTEVASGYRFQVREDLASWINRLWEEKPQKYSRAMLETLALIAYRQPLTRGDIEEVRGVAVSSHIIKTLAEREWVKVVGHRDVPGRPALYATTRQFLDYFNLKSLDELPTLGELRDIDSLNEALEFDSLPPEIQESVTAASADTVNASAVEDSESGVSGDLGDGASTQLSEVVEGDANLAEGTPSESVEQSSFSQGVLKSRENSSETPIVGSSEPSAETEPLAEWEATTEPEPSAEKERVDAQEVLSTETPLAEIDESTSDAAIAADVAGNLVSVGAFETLQAAGAEKRNLELHSAELSEAQLPSTDDNTDMKFASQSADADAMPETQHDPLEEDKDKLHD